MVRKAEGDGPAAADSGGVAVGAIDDYDQSGIAPVSFDSGVAPPPQPSIEVSGTDGLVDGDEVTITIVDGTVEDLGNFMVCTNDPSLVDEGYPEPGEVCTMPWDLDPRVFEASIDEATNQLTFVARRWFDPSVTDPIDCGESPGRCWLQVGVGHGPSARLPLSYDPSVPAPDPPPLPEAQSDDPGWSHPGPTVVDPDGAPTDTTVPGPPPAP